MHASLLSLLWFASFTSHAPCAELAAPSRDAVQEPVTDTKAEYAKRKKEAGTDVAKLWKLHEWCDAYGLKSEARGTLRAIIKADPGDRKAHELLGHVEYDGKWHDNEKKLEEYKKKKLDDEAKATGKVVYKGTLVDPADVPFLDKGMTKDASGNWVDLETQKKVAEGWVLQDLTWIPPAEIENIGKGLWKCGDKWLTLEEADKYHSEVSRWWTLANDRFLLYSTSSRRQTELALEQCEAAFRDAMRVYGKMPNHRVPVIVLNSAAQYGLFANGQAGNPTTEANGYSSIHGAYLAEALYDFAANGHSMPGVAFWDPSNEKDRLFGEYYVRHAAAQAFVEAIDPSPKAIARLRENEGVTAFGEAFWDEKQLPLWFRYGGAAYAERYAPDAKVAAGGNPYHRRDWSVGNITNKGGLDPLDRIFQFDIRADKADESAKLINEAGLLVAFALDGKCPEVTTKLGALKQAIKTNTDISKAGLALAEEIKKNEAKLRTFAGL